MPGSKPYRVHPLAWLEIEAAADWYQQRSEQASVAFIGAVFDALESVSSAPQRWPQYLFGTQRFVFYRFPFSAIYLDAPDAVDIVAIAHNKRKPGYWRQRL
jgi:toxin ParE1/3/4